MGTQKIYLVVSLFTAVEVYPTMLTNEKPRNVKRDYYLLLWLQTHFFFLHKCKNIAFKLFSENLPFVISFMFLRIHNWHTTFDDFERRHMLMALLCLENYHAVWLFSITNMGKMNVTGACVVCLWKLLCYCFESLLFYFWRFVCIYIICMKISYWMR